MTSRPSLSILLLLAVSLLGCSNARAPEIADGEPTPTAVGKADSTSAPVCDAIGTRSEGWYTPDGERICWASCAEASAARCDAIGSRSEGWYTDDEAGCMGGGLIHWDDCDGDEPPPPPPTPEPPICDAIGTRSEGWYTADGERICWASCAEASAARCDAIGSRSEGWYTDDEAGCMSGGLIHWDDCSGDEPPPPPPPTPAPPTCDHIGTRSEGWYTADGERLCWASCADASAARCDAVGSRSEGWYTDDGKGCREMDLIAWDDCDPSSP
jgi:hypothetical protein